MTDRVESEKLLRRTTEIRLLMSAQTPSGDRLAEWAELVDEDVPEEHREERSPER
jgi:DNA mismatch repair protein MutH